MSELTASTSTPKGEKETKKENVFKRPELIAKVAEKTGLPRGKANSAVEAVFDVIAHRLKEGNEVRLVGFGSFNVSERKAGKGRDPRTGVEIDIPESKSVRFRAGKSLREAVGIKSPTAEGAEAPQAEFDVHEGGAE